MKHVLSMFDFSFLVIMLWSVFKNKFVLALLQMFFAREVHLLPTFISLNMHFAQKKSSSALIKDLN
jgi:hypothetical protein